MNILVCITHVPDTTTKIAFTDNNTKFDKTGVQYIIGPYDDYAIARAVELKEQHNGHITVINVGLADAEPTIRKALAIGADEAIRVNSSPLDSYFVAAQIAHYAKEGNFDLILMGRESIDFNSGLVHGMVGEMLDMPAISPVMQLDIEDDKAILAREIEGGKEYMEVKLPLIAGCQEPIAEWKIPNMRGIMTARSKPLNIVEPVEATIGAKVKKYDLPEEKGEITMIDAETPEKLIELLRTEAKVL